MEEVDQSQPVEESRDSQLGFVARLVNVFVAPSKTFASLDQKPTWLVPLLLIVLVTIVTTQVEFPLIMKAQLEAIRNNPNISPEQLETIEEQLSGNPSAQRIMSVVGQIIVVPLLFLALSGIFYLVGTIFMAGNGTYKKVLSVCVWSAFITVLASLVKLPLVMAKGSLSISLSPALLLPGEAVGTRLHTLLSSFDFFTIWFLAVFALGFAIVNRFSKAKAYTAVGILWAIWIAISVVFSGFFSRFGM